MRAPFLWLAGLLLIACSQGGHTTDGGADPGVDTRPEPVCNSGPFGSSVAFVDASEEAGFLAIDATGQRITVADLEGDGYPDLLAKKDGTARGVQRVYRNVAHPTDATLRAFTEDTATGIDSNRRVEGQGRAVSFHLAGDVDNDGDLDVFGGCYYGDDAADVLDRQELLLNDGTGHFSLIPEGSSLATIERPVDTAGAFLDFDRDGLLDLFVAGWYTDYGISLESAQSILYRGLGDGNFVDVTEAAGMTLLPGTGTRENRKPVYGVTQCDIDGDGFDDLLVPSYGRQWNDLWRNQGDGTFVNLGESSGFDADGNTGFTDNEFYRCYCQNHPEECTPDQPPQVDCNSRGWSADDEAPFRQGGNTFGAECGDFDNDGDFDVFTVEIAHGWAGSGSDRSQLLVNNGERGEALRFSRPGLAATGIDRPREGVFWNEGDVYAAWLDYDNDGLLDLLICEGAYPSNWLYLYHQREDHTFRDVSYWAGVDLPNPHAVVVLDYDQDGDSDFIVGGVTGKGGWTKPQLTLYKNIVGNLNNWSRILLRGKGPGGANRAAIGATVAVTSGDLAQVKQVRTGSGQGGRQDELPLTFGFGTRCDDLTIEVRWPNAAGSVQRFTGVRANYRVGITEGEDQVEYLDAP